MQKYKKIRIHRATSSIQNTLDGSKFQIMNSDLNTGYRI